MDALIAFLNARLDEDAAVARAAAEPESWVVLNRTPLPDWSVQHWADPDVTAVVARESSAYPVVTTTRGMEEDDADARAAHVARHDPARVLREVMAKRQILALHGGDLSKQLMFCGHCEHDTPCPTLRLLALPYSDHPAYRPEWAAGEEDVRG